MRRLLALSLLFAMIAGVASPSSTQSQTEAAGETVPIFSSELGLLGSVRFEQIIEPFEDYEGLSGPKRNYHFALVVLTVENTSSRPLSTGDISVAAFDAEGYAAEKPYVDRGNQPAILDLDYQDITPGSNITGAVIFEVANGSSLARVVYSPDFSSERQLTIIDLRVAPVEIGEPVQIIGADGSETASIMVGGITDPFEGFSTDDAPAAGSRYVLIDLTVNNTGTRTISVDPYDFKVLDVDGFFAESVYFYGSTDLRELDYGDALSPGSSESGVLVFQIFNDSQVAQVLYGDSYSRQVI